MIAVIKTGGKQYAVKAGQILKVEKLQGKKGDTVSLTDVLSLSDTANNTVGNPFIKDASVEAKILDQIRDKKIIVFKKRRRQNYRLTQGHRQYLTVLKIESINHGEKKSIVKQAAKNTKIDKEDKIVKKSEKKIIKKEAVAKKTTSKVTKKQSTVKKKEKK
ncbi:MAG: 50S ribosomal protein L21 [Alphaproteobacteria bacterium MarineAlpha5_Bin6]|nr:MAG: 50S ribosomal protein L21 [Alphaproteobacteria bacterium MarineAlpha5_Bin7]PPR53592.1 MAG: 50S ribosomal protein L21 [Alphaproteobacteria bacterium MarineAlpha5_Bin6]|tara:strand:+ start:250 stop:732 length:483 start_codon:yes stop_codon:yes gene_type:complete